MINFNCKETVFTLDFRKEFFYWNGNERTYYNEGTRDMKKQDLRLVNLMVRTGSGTYFKSNSQLRKAFRKLYKDMACCHPLHFNICTISSYSILNSSLEGGGEVHKTHRLIQGLCYVSFLTISYFIKYSFLRK